MTDWDLLIPGIGLTSIGIVGVGIALSGIAATFMNGMHAVSLLTMYIGMIFLASGLFKDGFPSSARAKSATFITLGFLVTFGFAAAVTVSTQVPSIYAYIGLMLLIGIPSSVLTVASYRGVPYLKALAVIFIGAAIVGGSTFYAFGLVTPKPPSEQQAQNATNTTKGGAAGNGTSVTQARPANVVPVKILAGASAQGNPNFDPKSLTVKKGDGAEWTNQDNVPHTVTSKKEGIFDSKLINPNSKWLLNTATIAAGDYDYYCTLHPFMTGTLKISAAGSTASTQTLQNSTKSANLTQSSNTTTSTMASNNNRTESNASSVTGGGNTTSKNGNNTAGGASVTPVSIVVGAAVPTNKEFFSPASVSTSVGSMVTWKNEDNTIHTVTSGTVHNQKPAPDNKFTSGYLKSGDTFSFVFDSTGNYAYYCSIHPWMTGKVIVT